MDNPKGFARPELLVAPPALQRELETPGTAVPLVLDLRPAELFAMGHVPGAVHLDLWGVSLIDTDPAPLRAFLWIIEHQFALRGVSNERPIVVYDEQSGVRAARAFWFLEYFGHPNVRLLDGGFGAWMREHQPVTRDATPPVASAWTGRPQPDLLATWRDVAAGLRSGETVILDTRSDDEYYARVARAKRGGAIPDACHIEWTRALDSHGAFKPASELRAMFEAQGVTPERTVIPYCQGGYRAAHSYLALRLLGYARIRNYVGSWKEWGDREDLPLEVPAPSRSNG
ncbi:MAG: sulfurtransferase [Vicinamibacterales bacterium]